MYVIIIGLLLLNSCCKASDIDVQCYGYAKLTNTNVIYSNSKHKSFLVIPDSEAPQGGLLNSLTHVKQSLVGVKITRKYSNTEEANLIAELDGFGECADTNNLLANSSFTVRMKRCVGTIILGKNIIQIGQDNSAFMSFDSTHLSFANCNELVDFNVSIGQTFVRQSELRYFGKIIDKKSLNITSIIALANAEADYWNDTKQSATAKKSLVYNAIPFDVIYGVAANIRATQLYVRGIYRRIGTYNSVNDDTITKKSLSSSFNCYGAAATIVSIVGNFKFTLEGIAGKGLGRYLSGSCGAFIYSNNALVSNNSYALTSSVAYKYNRYRFNSAISHYQDNERRLITVHINVITVVRSIEISAEYIYGRDLKDSKNYNRLLFAARVPIAR